MALDWCILYWGGVLLINKLCTVSGTAFVLNKLVYKEFSNISMSLPTSTVTFSVGQVFDKMVFRGSLIPLV